jgi:hypothetical protein
MGFEMPTVRRCAIDLVQTHKESIGQGNSFENPASVPEILLLFVDMLKPILSRGEGGCP